METVHGYIIAFHNERPIDAHAVRALYVQAGWWPKRQPAQIARMLDAGLAVGVWDGNELIGFVRAVGDGVFRAYVEDVVVHSNHRHRGVASAMLKYLLDALQHIETISLFCTADVLDVYTQLGFVPGRNQIVLHRKRPT